MRTGRLGRVCGGAVDDDLVGGTAGGLVDAAAVLIHLPASVASRGAALALQAQGADGYEEELVARLRGFRPDFGLVATCFGSAPEDFHGESGVEARAHARRLQCPLVGFLAGGEFGAAGGSEFGALGFTTCLGLRGGEGVS